MRIFKYKQVDDRLLFERWSWRKLKWVFWYGCSFREWLHPTERCIDAIISRNYKGEYMLWNK